MRDIEAYVQKHAPRSAWRWGFSERLPTRKNPAAALTNSAEVMTWHEFSKAYRALCRQNYRKCTQKHVSANWSRFKKGQKIRLPKKRDTDAEWAALSRKHTDPMFHNPARSNPAKALTNAQRAFEREAKKVGPDFTRWTKAQDTKMRRLHDEMVACEEALLNGDRRWG
jgi:hypothetical protein